MPMLLDTSVLIRLRDKDSPEHAACAALLRSLEAANHDKVLCSQVLIEYWVVATRPRDVNGLGLGERVPAPGAFPVLPPKPPTSS